MLASWIILVQHQLRYQVCNEQLLDKTAETGSVYWHCRAYQLTVGLAIP